VVRATFGPRLRYVYRLEVIDHGRGLEYEPSSDDLSSAEVVPEEPPAATVAARSTVASVDPGTRSRAYPSA
jgi:hypothetical protein